MRIKTEQKNQGTTLLNKIIAILFGIFITSLIFSITIKALEETGIYIGLTISALIIFLGFYYLKKRTILRMIVWGMLITTLIGIIGYFISLTIVDNMLEGFSSQA
ncbi:hypothetical protein GF366_02980 [Candidatus Peregrinibacteria bacterium]|nr:hypothetical protein [Candidatus Peregrinibacteria bacterium]